MNYRTTDTWDEALWRQAEKVYVQAFPEHGRKNRSLIRRMFERRLCVLHTLTDNSEVIAMALSGVSREGHAMIIDYLAVRNDVRNRGVGRLFMEHIQRWAEAMDRCRGIIIEVESEQTPENASRIRFWERCGFRLTGYVEHYIWVPEPYRAMYINFNAKSPLPDDGETLFRYIKEFHKEAYRGGKA